MKAKTNWLDRGYGVVRTPAMCLCLTEAEFHQALRECDEDPGGLNWCGRNGARVHLFTHDATPVAIVTIRDWEGEIPALVAAMLVHEATHIKQMYMDFIGEKEPSHEFEAYFLQWVSQQLMVEFARRMQERA